MPSLPNLFIIGAMKAGTTSLHAYLNKHPNIFMSEVKEINFFSKLYDSLSLNEYKEHFNTDKVIRGESSQNYSKFHFFSGVPKRIHDTIGNDDIRFVYILRDPLKRVYSHYSEMQAQNCAPKSLEEYIRKDLEENEIVLTSCYKKQLDKYLEYYPLSKFKIVTIEDLKENKLKTLNGIFDFLGVEEILNEEVFNFIENASDVKTRRTSIGMFFINNPILVWLKSIFSIKLKNAIKSNFIIKSLMTKDIDKNVKLSDELEEILRDIFRKDVKELRKLTGLKFDKWSV